MSQIFQVLLGFGAGVGLGAYINSEYLKENIYKDPAVAVKLFTKLKKKQLSFAIGIICMIIVIFSFLVFYAGNQEHDGIANLIMNSASYITTSFALITALLFLDF
jgi:hypothetical protein